LLLDHYPHPPVLLLRQQQLGRQQLRLRLQQQLRWLREQLRRLQSYSLLLI